MLQWKEGQWGQFPVSLNRDTHEPSPLSPGTSFLRPQIIRNYLNAIIDRRKARTK